MKISLKQLKQIIKEEVMRTKRQSPDKDLKAWQTWYDEVETCLEAEGINDFYAIPIFDVIDMDSREGRKVDRVMVKWYKQGLSSAEAAKKLMNRDELANELGI